MSSYEEFERQIEKSSLQAFKARFKLGKPAYFMSKKYPEKMVQLWSNGRLEEVEYDVKTGSINVIQVLEENYKPDFIKKVMDVEDRRDLYRDV